MTLSQIIACTISGAAAAVAVWALVSLRRTARQIRAERQEQQYADRLAGLARDILYADQITGDRIARWREQLDQLTDQQPAHNGPTVRECAEADRRWPLEKHGE